MDIGRIEGFILVESPDSPEVGSLMTPKIASTKKKNRARALGQNQTREGGRALPLLCATSVGTS